MWCVCAPTLLLIVAGLLVVLAVVPVIARALERRYERRVIRRRLGLDHVHEWRAMGTRARCACGDEIEIGRRIAP